MLLTVSAERGLRLRNIPKGQPGSTTLALLPKGHQVELRSEVGPAWRRVRTTLPGGGPVEGVAAAEYLRVVEAAAAPAAPEPPPEVRPAQLQEGRSDVTRANPKGRAFPLGEAGAPARVSGSSGVVAVAVPDVVSWLDVERSARYAPTTSQTYCNIYAYDVAYLLGMYVPRVWWTGGALLRMGRGEVLPVRYGDTVAELSANSLFRWFADFGPSFGWVRTASTGELQETANGGGLGIIVARNVNPNRSGHITVVVPETADRRAKRVGVGIEAPLQSQAGRHNHQYFAERWWTIPSLAEFSMWRHP